MAVEIVSFPSKKLWFPLVLLVYQRATLGICPAISQKITICPMVFHIISPCILMNSQTKPHWPMDIQAVRSISQTYPQHIHIEWFTQGIETSWNHPASDDRPTPSDFTLIHAPRHVMHGVNNPLENWPSLDANHRRWRFSLCHCKAHHYDHSDHRHQVILHMCK